MDQAYGGMGAPEGRAAVGGGMDGAGLLGPYARNAVHRADGIAALEALPPGSVDAVVTDPPYNLLSGHRWDCAIAADRLFAAARRALKPTGGMVLFGRGLTLARWVCAACDRHGFAFREEVVWRKPQGVSPFLPLNRSHELAVVLGRPDFQARRVMVDPIEEARYDRAKLERRMEEMHHLARADGRLEVLARLADAARAAAARGRYLSFGEKAAIAGVEPNDEGYGFGVNRKDVLGILPKTISGCGHLAYGAHLPSVLTVGKRFEQRFHPTAKPVLLMRWLVRLCAPPGGVVVDPFAGGGSTVVAAVKEGRQGVGFERHGAFFEVARGRVVNALAGRCECGEAGQRRACPACLAVARRVYGEDPAGRAAAAGREA